MEEGLTVSKKQIRRLRLREGDALVIKESNPAFIFALAQGLKDMNFKLKIPIICAPDGIKRLNREYLNKILSEQH